MEDEHIILTEQYLAGKLDAQARKSFELRLQEDQALQEEYATQMAMRLGRHLELEKEIASIADQEISSFNRQKVINFRYYAVAAAATVLLLVLGTWWLFRPSNGQALFAEHFEPYPSTVGTLAADQAAYEAAFQAYEEGNYHAFLHQFQQLEGLTQMEEMEVAFFAGNAYLQVNKPDQAIPFLRKVAENQGSSYSFTAQYYLGLAYLAAEQPQEGLTQLRLVQLDQVNAEIRETTRLLIQELEVD